MKNNRREFISKSALGIFGVLPLVGCVGFRDNNSLKELEKRNDPALKGVHPLYPSTDPADVRAVVGASHSNFEKVQELVTARPELAKATQDWGYGDVESALGAASHMGRKDIAEFLMANGARPNIYTYAMLGKLNAVKAMIEAMPGVQLIRGPHGFSLMHHAQMRLRRKNVEGAEKEEQEALVEYLTSLGDANLKPTSLDITEEERKVYFGKYVFGEGEDEYFEVAVNGMGVLAMSRGEDFGRSLLRVDKHSFAPGGAPSVRIIFEVRGGAAISVTVHDPVPVVKAVKS